MTTIKSISSLILIVFLVSCNENNTDVTNNNQATPGSSDPKTENSETVQGTSDTKKTEAEMYLEAFNTAADLTSNAIKNKRIKDSIRLANKEKMYAFQIGLPMKDKDLVFDLYKKLLEAEIKSVYVVINPDDDYILVQYEAKDQTDLYATVKDFKASLTDITSEKIEIVNLNEFCNKKDIIKKDGTLKKKREDVEIPCLICD